MNEVDISLSGEHIGQLHHITQFCHCVLDYLGIDNWDLSVLLCDDAKITELNQIYRAYDTPTDVLSFSQLESRGTETLPACALKSSPHTIAGDIVISLDTMHRNAAQKNIEWQQELKRLLVHGILHLYGMDHAEGMESEMIYIQEKIIKKIDKEVAFS